MKSANQTEIQKSFTQQAENFERDSSVNQSQNGAGYRRWDTDGLLPVL